MPTLTGDVADPEYRRARATKAANTRHSVSSYVNSIMRRAPELTPDDVEKIRALLHRVDGDRPLTRGTPKHLPIVLDGQLTIDDM